MHTKLAPEALPEELALGEWRVRPAEGVLRAPDRQVRLEPKVAALLAYLLRHQGRMVPKEELLSAVWADAVVAPVALARAVSELRRALDDDPRAPRYIETFAKRGYRLIASGEAPARGPRSGGRPVWGGLVAACLALLAAGSQTHSRRPPSGPPVVIVAPFRSLSTDPETARLAAGLRGEVVAQLSRIGDVRVLESMAERRAPSRHVATLDGSVRSDAGRVRIEARLLEPDSGRPIWSETFERGAGDAPGLERDVAVRMVHGLRAHGLIPRGLTTAGGAPSGPEAEPSAYDFFRRGRELLARRDLRGVLTGQEAFERSLRQEPGFVLARTGLALALAMRSVLGGDPAHARRGLLEARRAAQAAPDLAEAHQALGRTLTALHRYDEALRAEEEALRLQPGFLMALADRGHLWSRKGRLDLGYATALDLHGRNYAPWQGMVRTAIGAHLLEFGYDADARAWLESALYVEPQRQEASEALARLELYQGDRKAARSRLQAWVEADPSTRSSRLLLAQLALLEGDLGTAAEQAEAALALPGEPLLPRLLLAHVALREGDARRSARLAREVEGLCHAAIDDGSQWWGHPWSLAAVAALRTDAAGAAAWYAKAVASGRREQRWDRVEPLFAEVRRHPAFEAALRQGEDSVARMRPQEPPPSPPRIQSAASRAGGGAAGS